LSLPGAQPTNVRKEVLIVRICHGTIDVDPETVDTVNQHSFQRHKQLLSGDQMLVLLLEGDGSSDVEPKAAYSFSGFCT
jgi:hypothetical protein